MTQYKLTVCLNEDCPKNKEAKCATNINNKKLTKKQLALKSTQKINLSPINGNGKFLMCWYYMPIEKEE